MANMGLLLGDDLIRRVRACIYALTVRTGAVPQAAEIAASLGVSLGDVEGALVALSDAHAITLAPGTTNIWMAHPFSAVPTGFRVRAGAASSSITYWANCAWDVLGIASLIGGSVSIDADCADCGEALDIRVEDGAVLGPADALVHFLVPPRDFYHNIGFT